MNDAFGRRELRDDVNGSWNRHLHRLPGHRASASLPPPVGPSGARASMFNGLADSIYAGTKNQAGALKWVKFLASADCQNIVGEKGVVFPAIPAAIDTAKAVFKAEGRRRHAVHRCRSTTKTHLPPPDHRQRPRRSAAIMTPAMDAVMIRRGRLVADRRQRPGQRPVQLSRRLLRQSAPPLAAETPLGGVAPCTPPNGAGQHAVGMVGPVGLEPTTYGLKSDRGRAGRCRLMLIETVYAGQRATCMSGRAGLCRPMSGSSAPSRSHDLGLRPPIVARQVARRAARQSCGDGPGWASCQVAAKQLCVTDECVSPLTGGGTDRRASRQEPGIGEPEPHPPNLDDLASASASVQVQGDGYPESHAGDDRSRTPQQAEERLVGASIGHKTPCGCSGRRAVLPIGLRRLTRLLIWQSCVGHVDGRVIHAQEIRNLRRDRARRGGLGSADDVLSDCKVIAQPAPSRRALVGSPVPKTTFPIP